MPSVKGMFETESNWLKAAEHEGFNRKVKIEQVGSDVLTDDNGEKTIIWVRFKGNEKGIILSKTNGRALIGAFGDLTEDWVGKDCQLTTKKYNFDGSSPTGWIVTPLIDTPDFEDDIPW